MDLMMFNRGCQFDMFLTEAHIITALNGLVCVFPRTNNEGGQMAVKQI